MFGIFSKYSIVLNMQFFDFHHHQYGKFGIYNSGLEPPMNHTFFSVGIHPQEINAHWQKDFEKVKEWSLDENCIAIGEAGLDRLVDADFELQSMVFKAHLLWAQEIRKPMIIHCVRMFSEMLPFRKMADIPLVIHGFNKKSTIAEALLHAGFYLSFGKAVLQNVSLQQIIKDFPLEKLFLETDDSDFDLSELYQKVSEIKGISIENLNSQIQENLATIRNL